MDPILQLNQVSYKSGNVQILSDVTFSVNPKEFLTITGPSGSGKSTLLRIMSSLISKTSGELNYESKPIESYDPIKYRREVSYCFQQPELFGTTVKDNLQFPFEIRQQPFNQKQADDALTAVGLTDSDLNKKVTDLSGGEKQRVALIRNMFFIPKILLLDEVTAGLDDHNKQIINNLILDLNQKHDVTIIYVTHDDSEIKQAQKVVSIVNGRLEDGANE